MANSGSADAAVWNSLALCCQHLGRHPEGAYALARCLRLSPAGKHAWTNLGQLLSEWGDSEQAAAAFRRAIELDEWYATCPTPV